MIELRNVTKTFTNGGKQFSAVDNVTLDINDGEIFGIIGFSGAGKSTLVRCINLLERPTSGNIIFGNIEIIGGNPIGGLVVIADGEKKNIEAAVGYLSSINVSVEVILSA